MGYCIEQSDAKFKIPNVNRVAVRKAILGMFGDKKQIGWLRADEFSKYDSIEKIFETARWEVSVDEEENIFDIGFCGEKAGEDIYVLFEAIAPYVEAGSYIEMYGEDGDKWRYVFDGKTVKEVYPKVEWE